MGPNNCCSCSLSPSADGCSAWRIRRWGDGLSLHRSCGFSHILVSGQSPWYWVSTPLDPGQIKENPIVECLFFLFSTSTNLTERKKCRKRKSFIPGRNRVRPLCTYRTVRAYISIPIPYLRLLHTDSRTPALRKQTRQKFFQNRLLLSRPRTSFALISL